MKKTGRPKVDGDKRTKLVAFYLTEPDANILKDRAEKGGFKSMSSLVTAVMEPIIQGGFSLKSGVRGLMRVQAYMEKNGSKFTLPAAEFAQEFLDLFKAPPPIVPDDDYDLSQLKEDLRELLIELENTNTLT